MKKILLATTAVVALTTISAEAFAADKIKLSLGGFMRHYVAVTNHDEVAPASAANTRAVDLGQFSNSEVYFRGNTKLDNGLTVAADIQLESSNRTVGARNFDIASLQISSDAIGAITVGSTTHAYDDFNTRLPLANGLDWGDTEGMGMSAATGASSANYAKATNANMDDTGGKGLKLKYVSPNFSGVNVFASYAAGTGVNGQVTQVTGAQNDSYSYGVAFGGEVGGAAVAADVIHAAVADGFDENHIGLSVGMAGFTVSAGYTDYNDVTSAANSTATRADSDGNGTEVGIAYGTGPYTIAAAYSKTSMTGDTAVAGDNEDTRWLVSGTYDMGAGVAMTASWWSNEANVETVGTSNVKVNGVIAGIEVGF